VTATDRPRSLHAYINAAADDRRQVAFSRRRSSSGFAPAHTKQREHVVGRRRRAPGACLPGLRGTSGIITDNIRRRSPFGRLNGWRNWLFVGLLPSRGRPFDSRSGRRRVTILGNLLSLVPSSPSSIIWYRSVGGDALLLGRQP